MELHTKDAWRRDGTLVYALTSGMEGGVRNRFWFKLYGDKDCPADELEANARMAQAAPLLFEALTSALEDWDDGYRLAEVPATKALIARALGVSSGLTDDGYGEACATPQQPPTDDLADLAARLLAKLDASNPRYAKVREAIYALRGGSDA